MILNQAGSPSETEDRFFVESLTNDILQNTYCENIGTLVDINNQNHINSFCLK
jgi:hypothetical protein